MSEQQKMVVQDSGETLARIKDLEERISSLKERVLFLANNVLEIKQGFDERMKEMEKKDVLFASDLRKIADASKSLSSAMNNMVRKDEVVLVERMLKDFQPLEFVRKKDVEEVVARVMGNTKIKLENTKE
jgi:predicted nuclease with TOPRIM domain